MTKVNPNNGNETKSDIFPWEIFKSGVISFSSKNIKVFQFLSKSKFLSFMTIVNPHNGNEIKSDIFSWNLFKSVVIYFFVKKHLSISMSFKLEISQFCD